MPNRNGLRYRRQRYKGKRMLKHRVVWLQAGREIPKGYILHHKDLNPSNNVLSNLQLITRGDHHKLHNPGRYLMVKRIWLKRCNWCKQWLLLSLYSNNSRSFYSKPRNTRIRCIYKRHLCRVCDRDYHRMYESNLLYKKRQKELRKRCCELHRST